MSIRVDTSSWILGAIVCGHRGLGVLADDIPSTGDNGASFLRNDISLPTDSGKEICGRITSWPSAGALYAYEDGSFEFTDAPDGFYSFQYQLYVDGVASGTGTVSLQVGASIVSITATADDAVFTGSAGCGAAVSIDSIADDSVFSGGAASIPNSGALITAIVSDAMFSGAAQSAPRAIISAIVADAVFSGTVQGSAPFNQAQLDFLMAYIQEHLMVPTAEQIAAAVWAATPAVIIAKILRNKMVTDPATGTLTVFDDDNVTPLLTAPIYKDAAGTTPYNGTGAERRERLT